MSSKTAETPMLSEIYTELKIISHWTFSGKRETKHIAELLFLNV